MPTPSCTVSLDELFGILEGSTKCKIPGQTTTTYKKVGAQLSHAEFDTRMAARISATNTTEVVTPLQMCARHRDVSPSPPSSLPRALRGGQATSGGYLNDVSRSDESSSSLFRGVQRDNVEYSAISAIVPREPMQSNDSAPVSATSRASVSSDHILPYTCPTVNKLTCRPTSSFTAFSDLASEDAAVTTQPEEGSAYTTFALLQRFLEERRRFAAENLQSKAGQSHSKLQDAAGPHELQVFDALRATHLVPSVVPAVVEMAVIGKPDQDPYLIESTHMRAATITTVLKRHKAERHAAYSATHSFFSSQTALADAVLAMTPRTHLPTVFDMPLHLRCAMCQKHDSMCNRCHIRWAKLQVSYRQELAIRFYSMLDANRRGALRLLTAALGTGAFLEMMSIADGLALTQTSVRVRLASLELLLRSCGRVLPTSMKDRLTRAEDASSSPRTIMLKVAHVGCLFGQRDVLRSLWLRCRGGCSYAAQITTNDLHALELLAEPYEPALVVLMNRCAALREYLLWARIMQCLNMKSATDNAEATRLCAELRQMGSWIGVWSEALLAYVNGNKKRCVELCDELLLSAENTTIAAATAAATANEAAAVAAPRAALPFSTSSAASCASSAICAATPPQFSTTPRPSPSASASTSSPGTAASASSSFSSSLFSTSPVMDLNSVRSLKKLALRPEEPPPRLETDEGEAPNTAVRQVLVDTEAQLGERGTPMRGDVDNTTLRLPLRCLPFSLIQRILSYCDAPVLVHIHDATTMPLLQWTTLARLKCLPAAQWTKLLTTNSGYPALRDSLCKFVRSPTPTREEREVVASPTTSGISSMKDELKKSSGWTRAGIAVTMACSPFEPLHVSVVDLDDFYHLTVKATTLCRKTEQATIVPDEPLTVGERQLQSLFGPATTLVNGSKYLVLSRVCRLSAPDGSASVVSADVSKWKREAVQPWEVDIQATIRWCTYVQRHAEAEKVL